MDKQEIKNLIKELIEKTMVPVNTISILEETPTTWFKVEVANPYAFTKNEGEALHALNHLVKRILEGKHPVSLTKNGKEDESILIDINDFQKKHVDSVRAIAHMMSERARYFKSNIEVDPMSPFDRRIVHEFLANATDLKTESIGFGPTRRVVIKYIGSI